MTAHRPWFVVTALALLASGGNADVSALGPAYTRGEIEAPAGTKDMGSFQIGVYTADQQVRLGVDEQGNQAEAVSADEAVELLKAAGAELSLPSFEKDMSLLAFAFANMSGLPSPSGSLAGSIKVVSQNPYVLVIDNFLSDRECDFLRALGLTRLKPAMVVQSGDNWYDTQAQTRNNDQVWLTQAEERGIPLLRHIMKRIHRTIRVPDEYAEALQIGRYKPGTKYEGHIDSDPPHKVARQATMLTYLSDVEEGGHTVFPVGRDDCSAIWRKHPKTGEKLYGAAVCCDSPENDTPETVRVRPKKGRVAIFFSHNPDGTINQNSQHIGCPVIKGEKWIAQRWLRFEEYNRVNYAKGPGWDPRFDGAPSENFRYSTLDGAHSRVVSQLKPKLFLEEHFLDDEEIAHLLEQFRAHKVKDEPVPISPEEITSDAILNNLTSRVHRVARLPLMDAVSLTLKHIAAGGSEPVHMDSDLPDSPAVTVSVYLSTVEEGGELFFPVGLKPEALPRCNANLGTCCGKTKLKLRPRRGDAVLLYSYAQDGSLEKASKHGHCPLVKGEHWVAEWRFSFVPYVDGQPASKPLGTQPTIRFENRRKTAAEIFWAAPHGAGENTMGIIEPGDEKPLTSYAGHVFHVRELAADGGKLLDKVHIGTTAHQRFIITEKEEL